MLYPWPMEQLDRLYDKMVEDFPENERPKRAQLLAVVRSAKLQAWRMETDDNKEAAYALTTGDKGLLITHLAVDRKRRNMGYGSVLLKELADAFSQKDCLIVEVERPETAQTTQECRLRERRIAFYERAGYKGYPQQPYSAFSVPMMLMVLPCRNTLLPEAETLCQMVKDAYAKMTPPEAMHHICFK